MNDLSELEREFAEDGFTATEDEDVAAALAVRIKDAEVRGSVPEGFWLFRNPLFKETAPKDYHELRIRRPGFYSAKSGDYVVLARTPTGQVTQFLRWNGGTGELQKVYMVFDKEKEEWKEGIVKTIPPLNLKHIEIFLDEKGVRYVKDKVRMMLMLAEDYVKHVNVPHGEQALALQALALIRPSKKKPHGFEIVEEAGRFVLPEREDMFVKNEITQRLFLSLELGTERSTMEEDLQRIWGAASPKQRTDFVAATGIPLMNIIISLRNLNFLKSYLLSYGITKVGKTWIYLGNMKLMWGMNLRKGNALLSGDAIAKSTFRLYAAMGATNLPIYIDEGAPAAQSIMDALKAAAMGAVTFRGRSDQGTEEYRPDATIETTSQSNIFAGAGTLSDVLAMDRRLYVQAYGNEDMGDGPVAHDVLLNQIRPGGLIYYYLQHYTADTLVEVLTYFEMLTEGNSCISGILMGLFLMGRLGKEFTDQMAWDRGTNLFGEEAYKIIQRDASRLEMVQGTEFRDSEAKNLQTMILVEAGKIYLNGVYLSFVNSRRDHPLYGRFKNLGDLKQLAQVLGIEESSIYARDRNKRIGGRNGTYACLPLDTENLSNGSLTHSITDIINNIKNNKNNIYVRQVRQEIVDLVWSNVHPIDTKSEMSNTPESSTKVLDLGRPDQTCAKIDEPTNEKISQTTKSDEPKTSKNILDLKTREIHKIGTDNGRITDESQAGGKTGSQEQVQPKKPGVYSLIIGRLRRSPSGYASRAEISAATAPHYTQDETAKAIEQLLSWGDLYTAPGSGDLYKLTMQGQGASTEEWQ